MFEPLVGASPLSQVWFVLDYLQLQFGDCHHATILNPPIFRFPNSTELTRKENGFCDALVSNIGQSLTDANLVDGVALTFYFENGTQLIVPILKGSANNPEAAEIGSWIVFNT
jgi:hypothetical protein